MVITAMRERKSFRRVGKLNIQRESREDRRYRREQTEQKEREWRALYLQATSTVAGCPRIWPGPDHATHSHLNLSLPKYSSTSFLVTFNSTSTTLVPVRGSTKSCCCERSARSPLQRKYTCRKKRRRADGVYSFACHERNSLSSLNCG